MSNLRRTFLTAILAAIPFLGWTEPLDLYKEALLQETTVRDMNAAIDLYERVVSDAATPRPLAAKALVRLGACQARIGRTEEARSSWLRVTQEFSAQTEAAAEAREQLLTLPPSERVVERVVVSTPTVVRADVEKQTRFAVRFLHIGTARSPDDRDMTASYALPAHLAYYIKPRLGIGLQGAQMSAYGYSSSGSQSLWYVGAFGRKEVRLLSGLHLYLQSGPAVYRVKTESPLPGSMYWSESETTRHWIGGLASEAGIAFGMTRGLNLDLGYQAHALTHETPTIRDWDGSEYGGVRYFIGPTLSFSFRW